MRLFTVLLFMALSSYGQAAQNCRQDLWHIANPNKDLISSIIVQANESLSENAHPIRIELTVRCKAPLLSLPNSNIYKVYPIDPVFSLYVPECAETKFLEFLKMSKFQIDAEIPYIQLYTLENKNFDCLYLIYVERLKDYFMFGIRKSSIFDNIETEELKEAGAPSS